MFKIVTKDEKVFDVSTMEDADNLNINPGVPVDLYEVEDHLGLMVLDKLASYIWGKTPKETARNRMYEIVYYDSDEFDREELALWKELQT